MKPNSKTQSDQNLDFDGMKLMSQDRSNKFRGNQWSGHSNDGRTVNYGRGPTKGNQDYDARQGAHKEPPTAALPSSVKIKNPDYINGGAQVRGSTRKWEPSATQNYHGDIDKINAGRGPRKGNQ
jgi:hypothetical protein